MSLCQSSRYVLGVCVMSFLLNGTSSTEVTVQKQYKTATKTIEPGDWMPVGHADPLKNYPTYDYVPPTSGSVRYWSDKNENQFASNTSDKNEILLLGAATKHSVQLQSNLLPVFEVKSNKRPNQPLVTNDQRSSPYYPPSKPSRVLTPPSIQDYNHYYTFASHFMNNDLSMSLSGDTRSTIVKPKTKANPYSSPIYEQNSRDSIYHLAANVNSLEPPGKTHFIQSLLLNEKENTYLPKTTIPQETDVHSPKIYESSTSHSTHSFGESTTITPFPISMTTNPTFSRHNLPPVHPRSTMYVIIQGHSKVKTYGADHPETKQLKLEPKMVPITVKEEEVVRHVVANLPPNENNLRIKHLHNIHSTDQKPKIRSTNLTKKAVNMSMVSLISLLDSSLKSFEWNKEIQNYAKRFKQNI